MSEPLYIDGKLAIENSPLTKTLKAINAAMAPIRRVVSVRREVHRQERRAQRIHVRAGISRAPRRRTTSATVRRTTADSGGDSDGEPPPRQLRPRARGPPAR